MNTGDPQQAWFSHLGKLGAAVLAMRNPRGQISYLFDQEWAKYRDQNSPSSYEELVRLRKQWPLLRDRLMMIQEAQPDRSLSMQKQRNNSTGRGSLPVFAP